ncbi:MAG TPA: ChbG/HpnK family deacetylase [Streptosporangiaceae bacterium]|nr:ChbG/HpnK family deacetylase [Streptosporangiaceae bacterium]
MAGEIKLIVRADDFGMCHSVNDGILRAFTEGIVTQASVMVPCPWFTEAAAMTRSHAIPVGVHQTLTCEWDYLRWRPLTGGPSLTGPDGTFLRSVAEARDAIAHEDAVAELLAQIARFTAEDLPLDYLDVHMGAVAPKAYAEVADQVDTLFLYSALARERGLTSIEGLSERETGDKKDWLVSYLRELGPGTHMLVVHPAVGGPEIASITGPDSIPYRWAEEYRIADLEVLTDPEVAALISERGIELTTAAKTIASR